MTDAVTRLNPYAAWRRLPYVKSPIIIQVGARTGGVTIAFKNIWPDGIVYCFEPLPSGFNVLRERFRGVGSVIPINKAVADKEGRVVINVNHMEGTSSVLNINQESPYFRYPYIVKRTVDVEAVTVDGFCSRHGIEAVNLLMIDVQGFELWVLRGAVKMLRRHAIKAVFTEVYFVDLYEGVPLFDTVKQAMEDIGYRFENLYNIGRWADRETGLPMWADAMFICDQEVK